MAVMSDDYQLININGLDDETRAQIVSNEVNACIDNGLCLICDLGFLTQEERDRAQYAGKVDDKMRFIHAACWEDAGYLDRLLSDLQRKFYEDQGRLARAFHEDLEQARNDYASKLAAKSQGAKVND